MMKKFHSTIIVILLVTSLVNTALSQHSKSLYSIVVGRDGFSSFNGENYISIQVYLNNNSNDTLYYRGADCYNSLFSIKSNPYFHLANNICNESKYLKTMLAPHRAQKMELYLIMDKIPERDVAVFIKMNLCKWMSNGVKQSTGQLLSTLSDSTILYYDINHQPYWPNKAFEILEKKESLILPDKDIYLLTDTDRKFYTLTVEPVKNSIPSDTIITVKNNKLKRAKTVHLLLNLNNNSKDTLRFYIMTCSWYTFFSTNVSGVGLPAWGCDKNIPEIITVSPYEKYKRNLNIAYYSNIKSGNKYRISMSLLKVPDNAKWNWNFWPGEYVRFNKIWSNEIKIP